MKIWQKNLKNFLDIPDSYGKSCFSAAPEALPLLLLRQLKHSKRPLAVTFPDAKVMEKCITVLEEFLKKSDDNSKRIISIPECGRGKLLFPGGEARRARALNRILNEKFDLICGSVHAMLGPAPSPEVSKLAELELHCGMKISIKDLLETLVKQDYDDEVTVSIPGEFSHRGGIVDIFSPAHDEPCRIEFFGDEIESMRFFSPETQRSTGKAEFCRVINRAGITAGGAAESDLFEYLERAGEFDILDIYPDDGMELLEKYSVPGAVDRWKTLQEKHFRTVFYESPVYPDNITAFPADIQPISPDSGETRLSSGITRKEKNLQLELLRDRLANFSGDIAIFASSPEDIPLLENWCSANRLAPSGTEFDTLPLPRGFTITAPPVIFITENELINCGFVRESGGNDDSAGQEEDNSASHDESGDPGALEFSFGDFDEGDYVVHIDFGIAICRGIKKFESDGIFREVLVLEFKGGQLVQIPINQAGKVSRYFGAAGKVKLHAIGTSKWDAEKLSVRSGVRSYAAEMLRFQAVRQSVPGIVQSAPAADFRAFLRQFPFRDTRCQIRSTREITADMRRAKPMDRLLCGDVGFGKTEIAMRAAFQAVSSGYQVAVIAPTTVLAQQHFRSFFERFREYPFVIDCISRFRTAAEQNRIKAKLATGGIDIVIGTHRLCNESFKFKNLGLVIIDEEQRFGVEHKERLRRFRVEADVLSMSATPIPRTLYLAMAGARDLSTLITPPKLRLPVKTVISPQEEPLILGAIRSELARGGQVYYLHNRVKTIDRCAAKLRDLLPGTRIAVAHGQMEEEELAAVMEQFQEGSVDLLICSTIIESGLDVPNANTIIIERADRFGLAELYQLRGRVGRWKQQAYAYMLLPKDQIIGASARKRLAAIRRCSTFGSGFQLALRDLEIRGAGNILGSEQSGHLNLIGFDLYCRLLKQEIAKMQNREEIIIELPEIGLDFVCFALNAPKGKLAASLPDTYIGNDQLRIAAYRQLGDIQDLDKLKEFAEQLEDIFGKLPQEAVNLLEVARLRIILSRTSYRKLTVADGLVSISSPGGVVYRQRGVMPRLDHRDPPLLRIRQLQHLAAKIAKQENEK
ncbi:MAG: DEAD/DEAH box helicase [Lentisphaerae bacterium]|nr:DEAD/DEAH box helicase [Lentisphaerota bacterium]